MNEPTFLVFATACLIIFSFAFYKLFVVTPQKAQSAEVLVFNTIRVEHKPTDVTLRRIYTTALENGFSIVIETYDLGLEWSRRYGTTGRLNQPDGRYILFNTDRIADEIIIPGLIPQVEAATKKIFEMDKYLTEHESSFVDSRGRTWVLRD